MQSSGREPDQDARDVTSSLVVRLRQGDPYAGAELDRLYRNALVRFCWGYLGRIEDAEDAVQDICCKILTARDVPDAFRPWLYKTARNHCLNLVRTRARRKDGAALPSASKLFKVLTGQLTGLVRKEQQARLREAVAGLQDNEREALRLRYVEGLSRAEIGVVLEISESAVKSLLSEGLRRLRASMSSPGDQ